jgi:broad specificity phosphatase PhoE
MQITLMRHGKPMLAPAGWVAGHEMARWIAAYDQSSVAADTVPTGSLAAARGATVVMTSTLARAQSSAHALGHATPEVDALFCEARLPFPLMRTPSLPPQAWAAMLRLCWLCGYARGADSVAAVRTRAQAAAALLVARAADGPVLLVGHGVMNRFIARELTAAGWRAETAHGSRHWGSVPFQSP